MVQLENAFGLYQKAISIREEKLDLISSNIANQDTPGYKARDISFKQAIQSADPAYGELQLNKPAEGGMSGLGPKNTYSVKYRVPTMSSLDGNTVSQSVEKIAFMKNVVRYNSTLAFIEARKAAFMEVIKGE